MADIDLLLAEIEEGPQGPEIGAFFDFDGTLIDGYSAAIYFQDRLTRGDIGAGELLKTMAEIYTMQRHGSDVTNLMHVALSALAGRAEDELELLAEKLWAGKIASRVFPDARRLVRAHLKAGHTVAMASSATRFQAAGAAADLDIEHLLVTEVEVVDGMLTGGIAGQILWGEGKAQAVEEFAAERGLDLAESYAYGNGAEDVPYLETVGRPRPLNPDKGLAAAAAERDWPAYRLERKRRLTPVNVLRSGAALGSVGVGVGVGLGLGLLNWNKSTALEVAASVGSELSLAAAGVKLQVIGEEHLWSHRPAIFLFNHQSQLDVVILGALMRKDFTGVAKKELATDPSFAAIGWLTDIAYVDRGNLDKAKESMAGAVDALRAGKSLVVAPEGTRSPTPKLLPFKKGPFHMALQARVPVVPIVIRNAGELMESHSLLITPGVAQVVVHPPIPTDKWTRKNLDTKIAEIRQLYLDTLDDWPVE